MSWKVTEQKTSSKVSGYNYDRTEFALLTKKIKSIILLHLKNLNQNGLTKA